MDNYKSQTTKTIFAGKMILCWRVAAVAFFVVAFFASPCIAATLYMGPGQAYTNLHDAMAAMDSGDTLIIKDGVYTGSSNTIDGTHYPPDGSAGQYTVVKAENEGGVLFDGERSHDMFDYPGLNSMRYVEFRGIKWGDPVSTNAVQLKYGEYVKFFRCAAFGEIPSGSSCWRIAWDGTNPSRYVLLEECYAWGGGRYKFTTYQSNHIIMRRCVARYDYVTNTNEPKGAFNIYSSDYVKVQNCIAIDGDTSSSWDNTTEVNGAFLTSNNSLGSANVEYVGCIAINNDMKFGITSDDDYGYVDYNHCVGWDLDWRGENALFRGADINFDHCTFGNLHNAGSIYFSGWGSDNNSVKNTVFTDIPSVQVVSDSNGNRFEEICNNVFFDCDSFDAGTNAITGVDPIDGTPGNGTAGLQYLLRIEDGSDLDGAASDGGDIGATIMKRIGVSGSLWGETGYNDLTDDDLWPFPYSDQIWRDMRTYSDHGINGARGFCADGQDLTTYIWEYLGNTIPSGIVSPLAPPSNLTTADN